MIKSTVNFNFARFSVTGVLLFMHTALVMAQQLDKNVPMGWAVVPSDISIEGKVMPPLDRNGCETTTGGGDGELVTASSNAELKKYATSKEPYVIIANGSFSGLYKVAPNKTIIGGGSGATLSGQFDLGTNNILRNFNISGGTDGISVNGADHHIWIDHINLAECKDGLLDITNGGDHISVSWVKFNDHDKTMLINNGARKSQDYGRLKVSIHHVFYNKTNQRHPRCGIGKVHIFNTYWESCGAYGIHIHWGVQLNLENSYFSNTADGVRQHKPGEGGDWDGYLRESNNIFVNSKNAVDKALESKVYKVDDFYMYDWLLDPVKDVPGIVEKGVGPGSEWGKIGAIPTPGQGYTQVSTNPTLKWTKVGSKASNKVYFGTLKNPPEVKTVDGYSYQPGQLNEGTVYYWKINDGDVWKFRTKGTPRPTSTKISISTKKAALQPVTIKKGIHKGPSLFIGVQKSNDQQKIYDLRGKTHLDQVKKPVKDQK